MAGIFMDSGAFSAFTKKATIDLDKYISFLQKNEDKLEVYCCLDVIGDEEATWKNFGKMRAAGLHPLPVYHIGEDVKYLYRCLEYEYFCLGGMAKVSRNIRVPFLDKVFTIVGDQKGIPRNKIHGLGMTDWELMKRYPFYSVDSTAWVKCAALGGVYLPVKEKDGSYDYSHKPHILIFSQKNTNSFLGQSFSTCSEGYQKWILEYFEKKGYNLEGVRKSYKNRRIINVDYIAEFQKTIPAWPWPFQKSRKNMFF